MMRFSSGVLSLLFGASIGFPIATAANTPSSNYLPFSLSPGYVTTVAWNGNYGTTESGPALSATTNTQFLAADPHGNLFYQSLSTGDIVEISAQTGTLSKVAGNGSNFPFTQSSPDGTAALQAVIHVSWLSFDGAGNLYFVDIADTSHTVWLVRTIDDSGNLLTLVSGERVRYRFRRRRITRSSPLTPAQILSLCNSTSRWP